MNPAPWLGKWEQARIAGYNIIFASPPRTPRMPSLPAKTFETFPNPAPSAISTSMEIPEFTLPVPKPASPTSRR